MVAISPKDAGTALARATAQFGIVAADSALHEGVVVSPEGLAPVVERLMRGVQKNSGGDIWKLSYIGNSIGSFNPYSTKIANKRTQEAVVFDYETTVRAWIVRSGSSAAETVTTKLSRGQISSSLWADEMGRLHNYYSGKIQSSADYFQSYKESTPNITGMQWGALTCQVDDDFMVFFESSYSYSKNFYFSWGGFGGISTLRADTIPGWPRDANGNIMSSTMYLLGFDVFKGKICAAFSSNARSNTSSPAMYNVFMLVIDPVTRQWVFKKPNFVLTETQAYVAVNKGLFISDTGQAFLFCKDNDGIIAQNNTTLCAFTNNNVDDISGWNKHPLVVRPTSYNGSPTLVTNYEPTAAIWDNSGGFWDVFFDDTSYTWLSHSTIKHDDAGHVFCDYVLATTNHASAVNNTVMSVIDRGKRIIFWGSSGNIYTVEKEPGGVPGVGLPVVPLEPPPPPVITTTALPSGGQGVAYNFTVAATQPN